jgi:hypothetical protein
VIQALDGTWRVEIGPQIVGEHLSNEQAWRLADRVERQPIGGKGRRWRR